MPRRASIALTIYLMFMLTITLLIFHESSPSVNLRPFATIGHDWSRGTRWDFWVNLVGNAVAFLPIGGLLPAARGRSRTTTVWHALALGAGFSLTVELAQYFSGRRTCDVDDLILNTLGAAAGFGLVAAWRAMRGR